LEVAVEEVVVVGMEILPFVFECEQVKRTLSYVVHGGNRFHE
jgi:hypothetical protein